MVTVPLKQSHSASVALYQNDLYRQLDNAMEEIQTAEEVWKELIISGILDKNLEKLNRTQELITSNEELDEATRLLAIANIKAVNEDLNLDLQLDENTMVAQEGILDAIGSVFKAIFESIKKLFEFIINLIKKFVEFIKSFFESSSGESSGRHVSAETMIKQIKNNTLKLVIENKDVYISKLNSYRTSNISLMADFYVNHVVKGINTKDFSAVFSKLGVYEKIDTAKLISDLKAELENIKKTTIKGKDLIPEDRGNAFDKTGKAALKTYINELNNQIEKKIGKTLEIVKNLNTETILSVFKDELYYGKAYKPTDGEDVISGIYKISIYREKEAFKIPINNATLVRQKNIENNVVKSFAEIKVNESTLEFSKDNIKTTHTDKLIDEFIDIITKTKSIEDFDKALKDFILRNKILTEKLMNDMGKTNKILGKKVKNLEKAEKKFDSYANEVIEYMEEERKKIANKKDKNYTNKIELIKYFTRSVANIVKFELYVNLYALTNIRTLIKIIYDYDAFVTNLVNAGTKQYYER